MSSFAEIALIALKNCVPVPLQPDFRVTVGLQPYGLLAHQQAPMRLPHSTAHPDDLRLTTTRLESLVDALQAIATGNISNKARVKVFDAAWTWEDRQFDQLPAPVRMATRRFGISLSPSKLSEAAPIQKWGDFEGASMLENFCFGDDPRILIPGHNWVDFVRNHSGCAERVSGASCVCRPYGYRFELHDERDAATVEYAYGPHFGLPSCEVTRTINGPKKEREYLVDIRIPGAIPAIERGQG